MIAVWICCSKERWSLKVRSGSVMVFTSPMPQRCLLFSEMTVIVQERQNIRVRLLTSYSKQ